jgi:hypothetical protein
LRIRAPPYAIFHASISDEADRDLGAFVDNCANAEITLRLIDPVLVGEQLKITVPVLTPSVPEPTDAMWLFEILDDDTLPVNTNDAATEGFPLAAPLGFELSAVRSPPLAEIPVSLSVDPRGSNPTELILVAPHHFNITDNCLVDGASAVASCVRTADVFGRQAALLRIPEPGLLTSVSGILLMIITARASAAAPSWYLQARNTELDSQLGWAVYEPGIEVKQMPNAAVLYPGVKRTLQNQMVVRFQATIRARPQSKIRVYYPTPYTILQCAADDDGIFEEAGRFQQISLNGVVDCNVVDDESYLELLLHSAMDPGWQAFGVKMDLDYTPVPNIFDILVYEPAADGGKIIDGATSVPGLSSVNDLDMDIEDFIWGDCQARVTCQISIGFRFLEALQANLGNEISEIVVKVPPTLEYKITSYTQVKFEGAWPFRADWPTLDYPTIEYFRILLNAQADPPQFRQGSYRFQFATEMPTRAPANNVWLLIFCGAGNSTCVDPHDARAITTFPLVGFNPGDLHPTGIRATTAGTIRSYSLAWAVMVSFMYSWCLH